MAWSDGVFGLGEGKPPCSVMEINPHLRWASLMVPMTCTSCDTYGVHWVVEGMMSATCVCGREVGLSEETRSTLESMRTQVGQMEGELMMV
jgi:hypothetical protein